MLPDTLLGGFILTVMNMAVVLLVLGMLAGLIMVIHRLVARFGGKGQDELPKKAVLVVSSHPDAGEGEVFLPLDIEPAKRAAILAAIQVYLEQTGQPVFQRKNKDSGAWGRLSRKNQWGASGVYRTKDLARRR